MNDERDQIMHEIPLSRLDYFQELEDKVEKLEAERQAILDICTLKDVYVGDFYKDAIKKIKALLSSAEITS